MKKSIAYFIVFIVGIQIQIAQDLPPAPRNLVSDETGLLSKQQMNALEHKLVSFNDTTSTQIAIFITHDLQGYDIVDFSQRVGQKWGVGQKGKDNGVVIVLKPKTTTSKGEVNIEVGYGLEPIIPDITGKHIVDNEMIPRFKSEDYFGGLDAATDVIMALSAGHFTADEYDRRSSSEGGAGWFIPFLVLFIVITMIRRNRRGHYTAGNSSLPFWTALWLGSSMGSHGGSWNNFHSGSGGFGGGGGGFGGFGGGGFGGGGASGSW